MEESYRKIWDKIASEIQPRVSGDAFQRWFAAIELVQADELGLTFQVPNTIYQLWIESNYMSLVQSATLAVLGSPRTINFRIAYSGKPARLSDTRLDQVSETPQPFLADQEAEAATNHGMNPRHTL